MVRQKNPHPKRAENARTVVVASDREEREAREFREEEEERVLCLRIPLIMMMMRWTNRYEKKR
ncbi:unnamed protein product [Bathycoccus prasinos]|jgi:hypothetical protein